MDNVEDFDPEVKFWLEEISDAKKREKDFRKDGKEILETYSGERGGDFNILFSNTDTSLPALYSQTPRPVVQRRFKDEDPIGKSAAQAGQRALEFMLDTNIEGYESFDDAMKAVVLAGLLPGRGVNSIKYDAETVDGDSLSFKKSELVCLEYRTWNRVYFGFAKKWSKVPWVAYEEYIDKDEAKRLFGEDIASKMRFTDDEEEREEKKEDSSTKTACVYQIWSRKDRKVLYVNENFKSGFLKEEDDPLQLTGFFNCPRPLQFIERLDDLCPIAPYSLYEAQAKELDQISKRIKLLVKAIKAKGIYDSSLGQDIKNIVEAEDNELIASEQSSSLAYEKGIQNSIWMWPVEKLIVVLNELLNAREQCKRVIYEIIGLSDIVRGSTVASETASAQNLKSEWGKVRLKRPQKEVQRYARDNLRIMLEIAATKFSEETWAKMTGLPFVTTAQRQQDMLLLQAAQGANMQPDPALQQRMNSPVWGEVIKVLRDDVQRAYRIDIETNSTVEPEAVEDQKNISELMTALGQYLNGIGPLVAKGIMPFGAAQSMMLAIARRFRFGSEVEDYIKAMQAPPPESNQAEMAKLQLEKEKMQMGQAHDEMKMKLDMEKEVAKHQRESAALESQRQAEEKRMLLEKDISHAKLQSERHTEQLKMKLQQETELKKAQIQSATQIEIAKIGAVANAQGGEEHKESDMTFVESYVKKKEEDEKHMKDSFKQEMQTIHSLIKDNSETQNKMILKMMEATLAERETVVAERDEKGKVKKTVSKVKSRK